MGTFQISTRVSSFSYCHTKKISVRNKLQKIQLTKFSTPRLPNRNLVAELKYLKNYTLANTTINNNSNRSTTNSMELVKLHLILEIVGERLEMHNNVGIQRDNWNHLLLSSVNMMTLSAASMAGLAAITASNNGAIAPLMAMKVSSTILYMAATGILVFMNKVQPSQLAEEQRNATRLFKQLHEELNTLISLGNFNEVDVNEAMEKVLALDKAYPLPLLGTMLEKFPQVVKPAIWWPQKKQRHQKQEVLLGGKIKRNENGWDSNLEEEMKKIVMVLKKKDKEDYLRLSKLVLNLNKVLAISGPILTGLGALGTCFLGSVNGSWPVMFGVICGVLASVVNAVEHGGQVGMVFELYRGTSGFFKLMEETIEVNLSEEDYLKRENGELFEIKVALKLGRSVSELRQFSAGVSLLDDENNSCEEFASKLF